MHTSRRTGQVQKNNVAVLVKNKEWVRKQCTCLA